jgi:hypothetical protein
MLLVWAMRIAEWARVWDRHLASCRPVGSLPGDETTPSHRILKAGTAAAAVSPDRLTAMQHCRFKVPPRGRFHGRAQVLLGLDAPRDVASLSRCCASHEGARHILLMFD